MGELVLDRIAVGWSEQRGEAATHGVRFGENVQIWHGKTTLATFPQKLFELLSNLVVLWGQCCAARPDKQGVRMVGRNDTLS